MSTDYRETIFLPSTDFPMKAQLPEREPSYLARWSEMDLFAKIREDSSGKPLFVLHDGPPYANGHIHIGTALNKILKDVINRFKQMTGMDANYVPGWDCHGLPIEWQVEQEYRKEKRDKDQVPILEFREECRLFASKWLDIQRSEFQRLGIIANWDSPYTTMNFKSEGKIAEELLKFLMNGSLYQGAKPVMWSPVEKTALADAEVEYKDHESTVIFVRFPVLKGIKALNGASIIIWTTTPWTIPGNRAVAFSPNQNYLRIRITSTSESSLANVGEEILIAEPLLQSVNDKIGIISFEEVARLKGTEMVGSVLSHPWVGSGYDFDVPLLPADFVEMETGTGFVHIAPGHGEDDFILGQQHEIDVPYTVKEDGTYYDHVPIFSGKHVYKVADEVCERLKDSGALIGNGKIVHSYPHSWRSKAPLIFRTTPQWFISMEVNDLRKNALKAIENVHWIPKGGKNRIRSMVESRPAWLVSRQRLWGVPITLFLDKQTGEPLKDQSVNDRIVDAFNSEGGDCWYSSPPERFLGDIDPEKYTQVFDTLDVWFDSGSTHSFVLEGRRDLKWPASLYLEGSDQHRGWFQSSLLESCGTRKKAPYEAVLTHGFVTDGHGRKMSKSLGNVVSPQEIIDKYGADILRLWVISSDYSEDLRIGPEIIQTQVDTYRRLRNTLRYLLGNLNNFSESERLSLSEMSDLERWVLHRLYEIDKVIREGSDSFDYHRLFITLHSFCSLDLSSFYFDIRKDSLYCDSADSRRRRGARTVLNEVYLCLTAWFAPILCFTAEEAWLSRNPGDGNSIHLRQFPTLPKEWDNKDLGLRWEKIRNLRRVITGALENERREKRIGSSLEANVQVYLPNSIKEYVNNIDLATICITSEVTLMDYEQLDEVSGFSLPDVPDTVVTISLAEGSKCGRCWRVLPEVSNKTDLCIRCDNVVKHK